LPATPYAHTTESHKRPYSTPHSTRHAGFAPPTNQVV